ncbi:MAG: hypothetical protein L0Y44_10075 [Phycisphaerales bacterium]|nr:hypothetical protein [Phycisphaerales bacterium]MCI0630983.1 hypothetical protein [Phycisphaerales bacterium]MCI0676773.1 hypothetical protein [Phycisphaerales bacterium]
MFERLTDRARKAMALANQEAQRFNHEYIGTEHILLGIIGEGSGVAAEVIKSFGIDLRRARSDVEKLIKSGPEIISLGKLPQTPRAKSVIMYSIEEARGLHHNYVGTQHLLLGLIREFDGVAGQVLTNFGMTLDETRKRVEQSSTKVDEGYQREPPPQFELPHHVNIVEPSGRTGWALLTNEAGQVISPPMQAEFAREIVKRYNAHKER